MPYAPSVNPDPSGLANGIATAGNAIAAGLQKFSENKQKMDSLELSAQLLAAQHPDAIDPALLEKFSKGGLGQREALVGQMTASVAEKFKNRELDIHQSNAEMNRLQTFANVYGTGKQHPPDGTIATDNNRHEIGVWQGGKLVRDEYSKQWGTLGETLVNTRTGKPLQSAEPEKDNTPTAPVGTTGVFQAPDGTMRYGFKDKRWQDSPIANQQQPPQTQPNTPVPVQPTSVATVRSKAEYDALPAGSSFIGADGKRYRKP